LTVTSPPSCAANSAASYPAGPPPMIASRVTATIVLPPPRTRTMPARGSVRGLRVQHGPGADEPALPALAGRRDGVDHRLVAHLRRGGPRLGGFAGHAGGGAGRARLRRALRRDPVRRGLPGLLGGRRHRALPQDPAAGAHAGPRRAGLGVRAGRVRGRAALGPLPRGAGGRGGAGRGAGRLREPAADAALPDLLAAVS